MAVESEQDEKVTRLRESIKHSTELQHIVFSSDFLLKFLRARLFDVDKAKDLLLDYFSMRKHHPEMFPLASEVTKGFTPPLFSVMEKRLTSGEQLVILRPGKWDTKKHDFSTVISSSIPFFEFALFDEHNQKEGLIEVVDMRGFGWNHFVKVTPSQLKFGVDLTERTLPIRFKKIHICYENKLVDLLFSVVRPFLSQDLKEALVFHGKDLTELYKQVPQAVLPEELGGEQDLRTYSDSELSEIDEKLNSYWSFYST